MECRFFVFFKSVVIASCSQRLLLIASKRRCKLPLLIDRRESRTVNTKALGCTYKKMCMR